MENTTREVVRKLVVAKAVVVEAVVWKAVVVVTRTQAVKRFVVGKALVRKIEIGKPCSARKLCGSSTCRIQNPDVPRAGRGGAANGGAAGQGGAWQDSMPVGRFVKETTDPQVRQGTENNCSECALENTSKRNPI